VKTSDPQLLKEAKELKSFHRPKKQATSVGFRKRSRA
jgi:hypothetical protein